MPVPAYPSELDLPAADGADRATLVGVSMVGAIYRSVRHAACYRVLLRDEATLERRMDAINARSWSRQPGIAGIVEAEPVPGTPYFSMTYDLSCERSLVDVLGDASLETRLTLMARVLGVVSSWWAACGPGLVPLPADVAFAAGDTPWLLPPPGHHLPGPEAVLSVCERALFLAPEQARAMPSDPERLDRFALGVLVLRCLVNVQQAAPEEALLRAATGTALDARLQESRLPIWLERSRVIEPVRVAALALTATDAATRAAVDLAEVARVLARASHRLDPLDQARALRGGGSPSAALELIQNVLLEDERVDLLMLAGEISNNDLESPLEAIQFYERAIQLQPDQTSPYDQQLRVITQIPQSQAIRQLAGSAGLVATLLRLDARLWRDFRQLSPAEQAVHEEPIVWYLFQRGQVEMAERFLFSLVVDQDAHGPWRLRWWKLSLAFLYAETLLSLRKLPEVDWCITELKKGLTRALRYRELPGETDESLEKYAHRLGQLDLNRHRATQPGQSPGVGAS